MVKPLKNMNTMMKTIIDNSADNEYDGDDNAGADE